MSSTHTQCSKCAVSFSTTKHKARGLCAKCYYQEPDRKAALAGCTKRWKEKCELSPEAQENARAAKKRWAQSEAGREYNREYQKRYQKEKYATDPEYRARRLARNKAFQEGAGAAGHAEASLRYARTERARELGRVRFTGMGPAVVTKLREAQGGKCAICARVMNLENRKAIDGEQADHCHDTGAPRGLLCRGCNLALGTYEKHQRASGLVIEAYEQYRNAPPAKSVPL